MESKNTLNIVSLSDSISLENELVLKDLGNLESSIIYQNENIEVDIDNEDSKYKLIRSSELDRKLKSRDFNLGYRKYSVDGTLMLQPFPENDKSLSYEKVLDSDLIKMLVPINKKSENLDNKIQMFRNDEEYKNILDTMKKEEVYLYNTSKRTIDLLNSSIVIDAVLHNSSTYTNTLNLTNLIQESKSNILSGKIDLEIGYTKGDQIRTFFTTFPVLIENRLIEDVNNGDVTIEYLNGEIKIWPSNIDIGECIINNCIITYGNLINLQ